MAHRDSKYLGIGFAMSLVSSMNRFKNMMVAGVRPFVADLLVFTQANLQLRKCSLVAGHGRHQRRLHAL